MATYKIIIADDNKFFLGILENYLNSMDCFNVIACCSSIEETIKHTNNKQFDVLIIDLSFNGVRSLDYINTIRPNKNLFKVICLTSYNNNIILNDAIADGVDLFVGKDSDFKNFPEAIVTLMDVKENNEAYDTPQATSVLSDRQITVLKCCYLFNTEKEMCSHLNISLNTLKMHKQHLFSKTGTKNTLDLIKYGIKQGIIIT